MAQNLVSIAFSDAEITDIRGHVGALLTLLKPKTIALDPATRRELFKGGPRSELFLRQIADALNRNRHLVPAGYALDEMLADQLARDLIRPLLADLEQLTERLRDTEMALGSDLMEAGVLGYGLLKVLGKNEGMDGMVKDLGTRWTRRSPGKSDDTPDPAPPAA